MNLTCSVTVSYYAVAVAVAVVVSILIRSHTKIYDGIFLVPGFSIT